MNEPKGNSFHKTLGTIGCLTPIAVIFICVLMQCGINSNYEDSDAGGEVVDQSELDFISFCKEHNATRLSEDDLIDHYYYDRSYTYQTQLKGSGGKTVAFKGYTIDDIYISEDGSYRIIIYPFWREQRIFDLKIPMTSQKEVLRLIELDQENDHHGERTWHLAANLGAAQSTFHTHPDGENITTRMRIEGDLVGFEQYEKK